jgi:hypothetical protein
VRLLHNSATIFAHDGDCSRREEYIEAAARNEAVDRPGNPRHINAGRRIPVAARDRQAGAEGSFLIKKRRQADAAH